MSRPLCDDREASVANSSVDDTDAWTNRRASAQATRAANARQVSGRRRFVDPTTSEREYTDAEMEFMMAMNEYKRTSGRNFPTWSEVLEVLQGLGYEKVPPGPLSELKNGQPAHASAPGG
jgi:hypothetical protein